MVIVSTEAGSKRVFACALDWPGWCRSGKTEQAALEALAQYAPRYAPVAARVGARFPARVDFDVVERLAGSGATDFGVPGAIASRDLVATDRRQAKRLADFVATSWEVFADVVSAAPPTLRKGPRGGGRDRDAIAAHVVDAEFAYARKIGVRMRPPAHVDAAAIEGLRSAMLEVLRTPAAARSRGESGWPVRYAARRIAWHALDHAWEIEDKS